MTAEANRLRGLPWTQAFIEALPLAPFWGGLALTAAQFGFGLAYLSLIGDPLQVLPSAVFALLVGAAPAASVYARRATQACLRDLRPAFNLQDGRFTELAAEVTRWDPFWGRGVQAALVPILLISIFSLLFVSGSAGEAVPFTQVLVVTIAAISPQDRPWTAAGDAGQCPRASARNWIQIPFAPLQPPARCTRSSGSWRCA